MKWTRTAYFRKKNFKTFLILIRGVYVNILPEKNETVKSQKETVADITLSSRYYDLHV